MKQKFIRIMVGFAALILAVYVLPDRFYNAFVYSILVIFPLIPIIRSVIKNLALRNSIIVLGELLNFTKENERELVNINYLIEVEFLNPSDNKKYILRGKQFYKPANKEYKIKINSANPQKSIIVLGWQWPTLIILASVVIIFSTFLIRELASLVV